MTNDIKATTRDLTAHEVLEETVSGVDVVVVGVEEGGGKVEEVGGYTGHERCNRV